MHVQKPHVRLFTRHTCERVYTHVLTHILNQAYTLFQEIAGRNDEVDVKYNVRDIV